MVRRAGVLLSAVLVVVALGTPAEAASAKNLNREVTGQFTGRQNFAFGEAGCSFVHQVFTGTYEARKGSGSFVIDTCVDSSGGSPSFAYEGTFELTTPKKAVLRGTVTGTTDASGPYELTLFVTEGTKRFTKAVGTIELSGTWTNDPNSLGTGPTSGQLTGALSRR